MKRLITLIVLPCLVLACKPSSNGPNEHSEPRSIEISGPELLVIASEFPAFKLDGLVEEVSQKELEQVIEDGDSEGWTRTKSDAKTGEITIQNKVANDNIVKFKLYGRSSSIAMIAVQQVNAQVAETELWEYYFKPNGDHPERWNQYILPEYKLESFFDERIILPDGFKDRYAKGYLDFNLDASSFTVSLNKWTFLRELENSSMQADGPLYPTLIKYKYIFKWNGVDLEEQKVNEAGYNDELLFTSRVVEPNDDGPGPHEFDCGHGVSVKASSVLPKQGGNNYSASNMLDGSDATAWSEGVTGYGEGEWIEFTITENFLIGSYWQIGNGYNRNKDVWQKNSRVKKMRVLVDDQFIGYVMLSNVSTYQSFNIAPSWLKDPPAFKKGTRIKFVIEEVYKGSDYDDTLISYFLPTGNCG